MNTFISPVSFYFIRHGETDWNREGRLMGQKDIPLNHVGEAQAHKAAHYLQDIGIERIVSSPLQRAQKTAKIINSYLNVPLNFYDNLKECSRGREEGLLTVNLNSHNDWLNGISSQEGESAAEFQIRIVKAVNHVIQHDQKTLIVAHAGIFAALMQTLGYTGRQSANCIPYLFKPPEQKTHPWLVYSLLDSLQE
jgi:broad specificity phosphatase PhoE